MVQDRNRGSFRIEHNDHDKKDGSPFKSKKGPDFGRRSGRKALLNNLNDSRFESFNKSPSCVIREAPSFTFAHSTSRTEDLFMQNLYTDSNVFGRTDSGPFYDASKDRVMQKLNRGLVQMSRQPSRGINRSSPDLNVSCVDIGKANETYGHLKNKRGKNAPEFAKQLYRDESKHRSKNKLLNEFLESSKDLI
jgi:hypothetical protein